MKKKSIIISEDSHHKLRKISVERKKLIGETIEEIINTEFKEQFEESPKCNDSTNT